MKRGLNKVNLNPLLFIQVINVILKNVKRKIDMLQIANANDIILLADSYDKLQKVTQIWAKEIQIHSMEINVKKTKLMIINIEEKLNRKEKPAKNSRRGSRELATLFIEKKLLR